MKVVTIDDEKAMHLIMKRMIAEIDNVDIVGSFQRTSEAFSFLQNNLVDLVFVDINIPRENGLDFAKRLRELDERMKIVFVTSYKEYALSAFDVYAFDYIVKPLTKQRLNQTIKRALEEESSLKAKEQSSQEALPSLVEPLTKREKQVLQLMGNGLSNKEIAKTFNLTEGTIKNHVVNIFGKLQVKNRVQAILIAKELKQIT
ncbi:DNA-binding NarL/FixJ family response regulator [Pullulanibacillus pueri]|uniref:DNA-binding response regulator n=1 Tax=Pullulanibacillus pueri TaxID=1437324 RepID=A0A8J2ZX84_9BACL|nr:response regulator transcription factor [Pullulanibacillus pueri]MBM7682635.1 DNA-binding NarL/FixJ family response regulator [Pullulanibacillus pueri]GGH82597.1 hypothetical protein GCM10007096_22220 [Pullulanibacillus pueri]